ncbi:SulP family inorganic anion transporter [Desulfobacter vibrioformis]|uniref:SulP family inorganic anion transporter n=1 Tax=Desulfobacter vibrioformis TaxID=34031 RepID=UPI00069086FB|nr:SulP family inorganic anion transporter [Desulfobacter vibrioformis]
MIQKQEGPGRFKILQGILPVHRHQIPGEIIAGITLAALAIPEVMGYTKIAGTPVITGLYTMLLPLGMFAVFGSSRHLVVGADSATAAMLSVGLAGLAPAGSADYVALAGVLSLMVAGFLLIARVFKLGFLANFLSRTVLVGFLTGIGIQVALGQIPGMLGLSYAGHAPVSRLLESWRQFGHAQPYDLGMSAGVLVIIIVSKRLSKKIPGPLITRSWTAPACPNAWIRMHTLRSLAMLWTTIPGGQADIRGIIHWEFHFSLHRPSRTPLAYPYRNA